MDQEHDWTERGLRATFTEYRQDPPVSFHVKLRRDRARQLRELLSSPDTMDLKTFNSDVWVLVSGAYLDGEDIRHALFNGAESDQLGRYAKALEAGELELHGNFIWRPPTYVYGTRLTVDEVEKTENIRETLRVLNNTRAKRWSSTVGAGSAARAR